MPELPEVETVRRELENHLVGKRILYTVVRNSQLRYPISDEIKKINNQLILSVQRRAKYLIFKIPRGWITIHFGMSGSLRFSKIADKITKHDHIDLIISNGNVLRYTDPRRFGFLLWNIELADNFMLEKLGPEPLSNEFNSNYLFNKLNKKRMMIKQSLMNNKIVVGLGNIYSNECLFAANILPNRFSMTLSETEVSLLVKKIKSTLLYAIEQGGTTIRNFLKADGNPGSFGQHLKVYGRADQPCYLCKNPISSCKQGQRITFWCSKCQN